VQAHADQFCSSRSVNPSSPPANRVGLAAATKA
jgi:hypothetical protein